MSCPDDYNLFDRIILSRYGFIVILAIAALIKVGSLFFSQIPVPH